MKDLIEQLREFDPKYHLFDRSHIEAADFIEQQAAEIERLNKENEGLQSTPFSEEAYEILQGENRKLQAKLDAAQAQVDEWVKANGPNGWVNHLREECNSMAAKLYASPVVQQAWQPIETAPKDGRNLILLLTPSGFPQVAYSNTWWTAGFSAECKPTHWMPLPAAPAIGGQQP